MQKLPLLMFFGIFVFLLIACEEAPSTYTVTYQDFDGRTIATYDVLSGDDAPLPADPIRDGFAFIGWDQSHLNVIRAITLQAIYEAETQEALEDDEPASPPEVEVPDPEPVLPRAERPILVVTKLEGLDATLTEFFGHPYERVDSIIDVDWNQYQRAVVLYNDSLRKELPPRLLGRPNLDANHFVTFTNDSDIDVTLISLDDRDDYERFLTTVDTTIFEIRDPASVYDYYPIQGTVVLDASRRFDADLLQLALGEEVRVMDGSLNEDVLLHETIYVFLGNLVPTFLSTFDDILRPLDHALTVIELDRGQRLIVGRATGEWAEEYYAAFIDAAKTGISAAQPLSLSPPEGIVFPTPREVTADMCTIEDTRTEPQSDGQATVSNFIPPTRIPAQGNVNALGILIKFEDVALVQSASEFEAFVSEVHDMSVDYFDVMSEGEMTLNWTLHPEIVTAPFFLSPEIGPGHPSYEALIHEHIEYLLAIVEETTDLTDVDMINFYWPAGLPEYVYGGLSAMTDEPLDTRRGEIYNYSVKKVETKYFREPRVFARSVIHGVGHNLGLTDIYIQEAALSYYEEYDSITDKYGHWDIMTAADNEFNAWHRWMMKWVTDDEVHCQPEKTNDRVEIFLEPLNRETATTRQIVIKLSNTEALSIALRDPGKYCPLVPIDVGLSVPQGGCTQNVLVTHIDTKIGTGNGPKTILRTERSTAEDFSDGLMREGESVTFEHITITHRERYAAGSVIEIRFD